MRFAVMTNLHANVAALEAILADIQANQRGVERIVSAGDSVGLGPFPNEVIDLLRAREIESVRGNYDDAVAFERLGSGVDFPTFAEEQADALAVAWTRSQVRPDNLQYLRELPRTLQLVRIPAGLGVKRDVEDQRTAEYRRTFFVRALLGGLARTPKEVAKKVMVMHGSPRALNENIRPDTARSILANIAREAEGNVLVTGHAGLSFATPYDQLTFVGSPSTGRPATPKATAEYGIVYAGEEIGTEVVRVPYDAGAYLEAIDRSGLPRPVTSLW